MNKRPCAAIRGSTVYSKKLLLRAMSVSVCQQLPFTSQIKFYGGSASGLGLDVGGTFYCQLEPINAFHSNYCIALWVDSDSMLGYLAS